MELAAKGLLGGLIIVGIGLFGQKGENALAAVMIQIPVITIFGLWAVAAGGGNEAMGSVARAAFFSAPIFWAFIGAVFLLRGSAWPPALVIAVSCLVWLLAVIVWLELFRDRL
jgi:uncharacterized membrane protein (GlpM family)